MGELDLCDWAGNDGYSVAKNKVEEKTMNKIIAAIIILITLTACRAPQAQAPDTAATGTPQVHVPNPASVHCTQQGNTLEIVTAPDGSQSGVCVFPDGTSCDEWAYYRGECGPTAPKSPTPGIAVEATTPPGDAEVVTDWWGVITGNKPGAQFDDCFERRDLGQAISFGIDSMDPAVQAQIKTLRDSGKIVHLYGTLLSNVPDCNGSQIQVERIEVEE
jgi:putative hemolysin